MFITLFRYPTSVMELIEELSHGIIQPFREEQKHRIKRTFVSGSDAAEAKMSKRKCCLAFLLLTCSWYKTLNINILIITWLGKFSMLFVFSYKTQVYCRWYSKKTLPHCLSLQIRKFCFCFVRTCTFWRLHGYFIYGYRKGSYQRYFNAV